MRRRTKTTNTANDFTSNFKCYKIILETDTHTPTFWLLARFALHTCVLSSSCDRIDDGMQCSCGIAWANGRRQSGQHKQKRRKEVKYFLFVRVSGVLLLGPNSATTTWKSTSNSLCFLFSLFYFLRVNKWWSAYARRKHQLKRKSRVRTLTAKQYYGTHEGSHQQMLAIFCNHPRNTCVGYGWRKVGASTCLKCRGESGKALAEMTEHARLAIMHSDCLFTVFGIFGGGFGLGGIYHDSRNHTHQPSTHQIDRWKYAWNNDFDGMLSRDKLANDVNTKKLVGQKSIFGIGFSVCKKKNNVAHHKMKALNWKQPKLRRLCSSSMYRCECALCQMSKYLSPVLRFDWCHSCRSRWIARMRRLQHNRL